MKTLFSKFLLLLFIALLSGIAWIYGSTAGLHWLLKTINDSGKVTIAHEKLSGTLWTTLEFARMSVDYGKIRVDISDAELALTLKSLLIGNISIASFKAAYVGIYFSPEGAPVTASDNTGTGGFTPLPLTINVGNAELEKLELAFSAGSVQGLEKLALSKFSLSSRIDVEKLTLSQGPVTLRVSGAIPLDSQQEFNLNLLVLSESPKLDAPVHLQTQLRGPFNAIRIDGSTSYPLLSTFKGAIHAGMDELRWDIHADFDQPALAALLPVADLLLGKTTVNSSGRIASGEVQKLDLQVDSTVVFREAFNNGFKGDIKGDGKVGVNHLEPYTIKLAANFNGQHWLIDDLMLSRDKRQEFLKVSGALDTRFDFDLDTVADLRLDWQNTEWPLTDPVLTSQQANFRVKGSLQSYAIEVGGDLVASGHDITQIRGAVSGTPTGMTLELASAKYLGGDWTGSGNVQWQPTIRWDAKLSPKNANLAKLPYNVMAGTQSRLSGTIEHTGNYQFNRVYIDVDTPGLSGKVNNKKLDTAFRLAFSDDALEIPQMRINGENTKISAAARLAGFTETAGPSIEADWSFDSSNLAELSMDLAGRAKCNGKISGPLKNPNLEFDLTAQAIDIGANTHIASASATARLYVKNERPSLLQAKLNDVSLGSQRLNRVDVDGSGMLNAHKVSLSATLKNTGKLTLLMSGGFAEGKWDGAIDNTQLIIEDHSTWIQTQPALFTYAQPLLDLKPLCLSRQNFPDSVCLTAAQDMTATMTVSARLDNIALQHLHPWYPPQLQDITGSAFGGLKITATPGLPLQSSAQLRASKGDIVYKTPKLEQLKLQYEDLRLTAATDNNQLNATAEVNLPNTGKFHSQWSLADLDQLGTAAGSNPLNASLDLNFDNLEHFPALLPTTAPTAQKLKGTWNNQFTLTGTLQTPILTGASKLVIDNFSLPDIGISPVNTLITALSHSDKSLHFSGQTHSGDGHLDLAGTISDYRLGDLRGEFTLNGSDFLVLNTPEASLIVSPNLTTTLDKQHVDIRGLIQIPKAFIKVYDSSSVVTLSTDITIVGKTVAKPIAQSVQVNGELRFELGDQVKIETLGFSGYLKGSIHISETVGKPTTATGELDISKGKYSAYGRELDIEDGKLLYASSPIDNPAISLKAVVHSSNNVTAGVRVSGLAQTPVVTLISEPAMDQADILAYIILGYPINQASSQDGELLTKAASSIGLAGGEKLVKQLAGRFGIDEVKIQSSNTTKEASLVLGKYLSPKLYVQYAVGVGETVNSMQLQYKLTDRWLIKSESGLNNSTDILYSIEKD